MASYIQAPIRADKDALAQDAYDAIQAKYPTWKPAEGNFEAFLIEILCQVIAVLMQVASDVPATILRFFGLLIGLPPIDATAASVNATITVRDDAGYTIPQGTIFSIPAAGDNLLAFATQNEAVILTGDTTADVVLISQVEGIVGTGLAGPATLVDAIAFITNIALEGPTGGGADAEDDETYLQRLVARLRLMLPRPVYPDEYATFARSVPGVHRCKAINRYDPDTDTDDLTGFMALALMSESGTSVSDEVKAVVREVVAPNRGVLGITVKFMDPEENMLAINFTGISYAGHDPALVNAAAIANLQDFINPARFASGQPGEGEEAMWLDEVTVQYQDLVQVLKNTTGFHSYTALTLNGGTRDVVMTGRAAVPDIDSTVTGSVTSS